MNDQIQAATLRVIDDSGHQLGILSRAEALSLASQRGLDLVEISPGAEPPVAKIIDWGKYNYQKTKAQQKNRRLAKPLEMKQIRFGIKIGQHDLAIKLAKVSKFLEAGHKVKIICVFRGREQAHKEIGFKITQDIIDGFGDTIVVEQPPQLAGRQLSFVIRNSGRRGSRPADEDSQSEEGESSAQAENS